MFKKLLAIVLCFAVLSVFPVSCGNNGSKDYPFTLGGIRFDSKPSKVVSLSPSFTEIIYFTRLSGNFAGRSDDCTLEAAANRPTFGTQSQPETEKLISENIDVILCDTALPDEAQSALLSAGIKVITLNPATNRATLKQLYANIGSIMAGIVTGKNQAEAAADSLLISMDDVQRYYGGEENSVTVCVIYDTELIKIATGDTMMNLVIECSGGTNIALEGTGNKFDRDTFKIANPQFIICPEGVGYDLRRNKEFQDMQAFDKRRIYEVDRTTLNCQGDSLLRLTQKIAEIIHPNFDANNENSEESTEE